MAGGDRFEKEIAVFEGVALQNSAPQMSAKKAPLCFLEGRDRAGQRVKISLDEDLLSKHLMFLGGIGTGKTNALYHLIDQLRGSMADDDVMVIFDSKGDFYDSFYQPGDVVFSNDQYATGPNEKDYWNLFNELDKDEHLEENLVEIARTLFYEKLKSSKQPFFPNAAKDLFYAVLYLIFDTKDLPDQNGQPLRADNLEVRDYFDRKTLDDIRENLLQYPEFKGFLNYISSDTSDQTQGVYSEIQQLVHEIFLGNFKKIGTLSIRKLIRERSCQVIFIEYDLAIGNMLSPIYRLLFDLAIKEALSRQENRSEEKKRPNVFLIADEFRLIPHLQHIDNAVNFGRSLGVKIMIGVQNVDQLTEIYGRERANSIMSGFSTKICFRLNDGVSRQYFQSNLGNNRKIETYLSTVQSRGLSESVHYANVVEDWDITTLELGEAIVSLPDPHAPPFFLLFDKYTKPGFASNLPRPAG